MTVPVCQQQQFRITNFARANHGAGPMRILATFMSSISHPRAGAMLLSVLLNIIHSIRLSASGQSGFISCRFVRRLHYGNLQTDRLRKFGTDKILVGTFNILFLCEDSHENMFQTKMVFTCFKSTSRFPLVLIIVF